MNKNLLVIGLAAVLVVVGVGYALSQNRSPESGTGQNMEKAQDSPAMEKSGTAMENKTMPDEAGAEKMAGRQPVAAAEAPAGQPAAAGMYKDFSGAALEESLKSGNKTVLFFWAAWCPFCKQAHEEFIASAGQIPAGVTVLKVNYDTERELKTKYGVTYQHTFVQVDGQGSQVAKWNGGGIKELSQNLK